MAGFAPAWWLRGANRQTIGARMLRSRRGPQLLRERWSTPDGDFLDLDFSLPPARHDATIVLVLHGLEGSSRSGYALELYRQLARHRLAAVGLNFRSCSGELNRAPRLYHSGETADPAWVIEQLLERHGLHSIGAVGVSLGGNVLLKLLGEQGASCTLGAAASCSAPFDLAAGAAFMEHGFARVYVRHLLGSLQRKLVARAAELDGRVDLARALAATSFRGFDDAATAPLHGFAGADDYYGQSSCGRYLHGITVPTLVVHADDDPFFPAAAIPRAELAANPAIEACLCAAGGHVGFVAGRSPLRPRFWAEEQIADWIAGKLL